MCFFDVKSYCCHLKLLFIQPRPIPAYVDPFSSVLWGVVVIIAHTQKKNNFFFLLCLKIELGKSKQKSELTPYFNSIKNRAELVVKWRLHVYMARFVLYQVLECFGLFACKHLGGYRGWLNMENEKVTLLWWAGKTMRWYNWARVRIRVVKWSMRNLIIPKVFNVGDVGKAPSPTIDSTFVVLQLQNEINCSQITSLFAQCNSNFASRLFSSIFFPIFFAYICFWYSGDGSVLPPFPRPDKCVPTHPSRPASSMQKHLSHHRKFRTSFGIFLFFFIYSCHKMPPPTPPTIASDVWLRLVYLNWTIGSCDTHSTNELKLLHINGKIGIKVWTIYQLRLWVWMQFENLVPCLTEFQH